MQALRTTIRGTGEVMMSLGLVLLLFCVYQLVWTNVEANAAADAASDDLRQSWDASSPAVSAPAPEPDAQQPPPSAPPPPPGDAFAFIHIPRLGDGWVRPVVEGVTHEDLARGVGHYPTSPMPGVIGNFALAGHRATNGEPFRELDKLQAGDAVVIETGDSWYTYTMRRMEIVAPTQVDVLLPVPRQPGANATQPLITLTTCHPRWASTQRMIWYGDLTATQPKGAGPPPALGGPAA
jgi:sortase A